MVEIFYPVRKNNKYAFIDIQGNLITKFDFDFANIYGGVKIGENYGYINNAGSLYTNPKYKYGYGFGGFDEGFAIVEIDKKFGFINTNNELVIDTKYYDVSKFNNGIALVKEQIDSSSYFIDKNGVKILSERGFLTSEYNEELINCKSLEEKKWGFIDIDNNFIIPPI